MPKLLPSPIRGGISLLLISLNTICCCTALLLFTFIKLIIPYKKIRNKFSKLLIIIGTIWIEFNDMILKITQKIKWDINGIENLFSDKSYLVISNHRSWADILVLQHSLKRKIPFLKFFLKKELIWVPLIGIAWWALDFPFLKRYSQKFLEKHPEFRGKDMETTHKHCKKFKNFPISVMNFLEGTRFNLEKKMKQKSIYRHLLMPKAGGVAMIFSNMGDYLSKVINITIVYPENKPSKLFWKLLSGKLSSIVVRIQSLPIPKNVSRMNYQDDENFRERIQQWVNQLWYEKDHLIEVIIKQYNSSYKKN